MGEKTGHLGQVGGESLSPKVTPTITAGAYVAADVVGGALTFSNAGRFVARSGVIMSVIVVDDAAVKDAMELWLFDTAPAAIADNAPFVVSAADLETCLGVIAIAAADFKDEATKAVATLKNVGLPYKLPVGSSDLIGYLVTRGTPTYTGTDNLSVRLGILQD